MRLFRRRRPPSGRGRTLVLAASVTALLASGCARQEPTLPTRFEDRTADSGLPTMGKTSGFVLIDHDHDGRWDMLLGRHSGSPQMFVATGPLQYTPRMLLDELPGIDHHATAVGDVDDDGDQDLYLAVGAERGHGLGDNALLLREGDRYVRAPDISLADSLGRGRGAMLLDLVGDDRLDLLVLNFKSSLRLFENLGSNRWRARQDFFTHLAPGADVTLQNDPDRRARGYYATRYLPYDLDLDGAADGAMLGGPPVVLLRREGVDALGATYEPLPPDVFVPAPTAFAWGDLDGDLQPDIVMGFPGEASASVRILFGDGASFQGDSISLGHLGSVEEVQVADLDNDGLLDVLVAATQPNALHVLRNTSKRVFRPATEALGLPDTLPGVLQGILPADLDGDGFLDIVCALGAHDRTDGPGGLAVFANLATSGGDWLALDLITDAGRPAYGCRVRVITRASTQELQYWPAQTAGSSMPLPLHVGLGRGAQLQSVEVAWPSGAMNRYPGLSTNARHTLIQSR